MPEPDCVIKRKHSEKKNNRPFFFLNPELSELNFSFKLIWWSLTVGNLLKHQLCNLSEKTLSPSSSEILSPFFNWLKSLLPVGEWSKTDKKKKVPPILRMHCFASAGNKTLMTWQSPANYGASCRLTLFCRLLFHLWIFRTHKLLMRFVV